jgi:hypothetical protein
VLACRFRLLDRILRDYATVVFDFDIQISLWQHAIAELQNLRESV